MRKERKMIDPIIIDRMKELMPQYLALKGIDTRRSFRCLNPHHQDNHPSMRYTDFQNGKPFYKVHCFSCGDSLDIFDLVGIDYGLRSFPERFAKVSGIFSLYHAVPPVHEKPKSEPDYKEYDINQRILEAHGNVSGTDYFHSRGFSDDTIREYSLGYWQKGYNDFVSSINMELCYSIRQQEHYTYIIPIKDENGVARNFIARINDNCKINDYNPKSINMKGVQTSFLNEQYISCPSKFPDIKTLFVVESWANALSIEQAGGKAIALNSTANVERFLRICKQNAEALREVTFISGGDYDNPGRVMNKKIEFGIPEHNVPGLRALGIRSMPYNLAGHHKDANEYLTADCDGFTKMVSRLVNNQLGRFSQKRIYQSAER